MNINQIQDEIVEEFEMLNGDIESVIFHIVNLGKTLPEMPQRFKVDKNLIKGCHSKVWLGATEQTGQLYFYADSDTIISKGLVSLLLRIFNGKNSHEILNADLYFIKLSHLDRFIGTKRSNGFFAMIDHLNKHLLSAHVSGAIFH
jgi:cysteine desulfuration protein SufE